MNERIKVKMDDLTFLLSPLTFDQKTEIQALSMTGEFKKTLEAAKLAVKYSVKDVKGLEDSSGKAYKIKSDDLGLTDECLNELLNSEQSDNLQVACLAFIKGIPKDFMNPFTNKPLKGVKIIKDSKGKKK